MHVPWAVSISALLAIAGIAPATGPQVLDSHAFAPEFSYTIDFVYKGNGPTDNVLKMFLEGVGYSDIAITRDDGEKKIVVTAESANRINEGTLKKAIKDSKDGSINQLTVDSYGDGDDSATASPGDGGM